MVVVERSKYESIRVGEILPPSIKNVLANLGVLNRFLNDEHMPSLGIQSAWGQPDSYENDFIFNPYGTGWHVDRRCFDLMLARASEAAGVDLCLGARLMSCLPSEETGWKLEIAHNNNHLEYRCRFLVDATGRESAVAIKHGAKRISYDHLVGVVGHFSPNSQGTSESNYMFLEAVEDGWWYSAVLPDLRLIVALMTDADLYSAGIKTSVTYFEDRLRKAPHTCLRATSYALISDVRVFSANSSRLDRITGGNWLAVGDAATAYDPLSSQGVYKALKSGLRAAQSIDSCLADEETALREYSSWVNESFDNFLSLRKQFYSIERRWPNSNFWKRRQREISLGERSFIE